LAFSSHLERRHLAKRSRHSETGDNRADARLELLRRMPIFGGIGDDALQFLLGLSTAISVPINEFFFHEGDQGDAMFVLQSGKVAVLKSWRGQECLLSTLKEGDCFGEMALMDHGPRSASVRATENCTAICLSTADLFQLYTRDLKQFALIQMNMGREVCRRLREADRRLFSCARDADTERLLTG
jgi:CRP/FNR family transcriptional regulator, cyclic AMP receptor protein